MRSSTFDNDGYLRTGDLGYVDNENYVYLKGRKKNIIVTEGGKNVFPEEIEDMFQLYAEVEQILIRGFQQKKDVPCECIEAVIYPSKEFYKDKNMSQEDINAFEKAGTFTLQIDGQEAVIERADVDIFSEDIPGWLVANEGRLTVALDITITDDLKKEGLARELVNRVQNLRKSSGFDITDKVNITVASSAEMDDAITEYKEYISNQVLANSIEIANEPIADATTLDFEDFKLTVKVVKA